MKRTRVASSASLLEAELATVSTVGVRVLGRGSSSDGLGVESSLVGRGRGGRGEAELAETKGEIILASTGRSSGSRHRLEAGGRADGRRLEVGGGGLGRRGRSGGRSVSVAVGGSRGRRSSLGDVEESGLLSLLLLLERLHLSLEQSSLGSPLSLVLDSFLLNPLQEEWTA